MTWVIKSYTIKKNHEIQFLTNQILNDKIKKKTIIKMKKKIAVKRINIKIEIKNKLKDN